uniref:Uncharacterized protein n=1 Tax=Anopheles arabiensis TaxID=7173 RepID=A0A182IHN7_ANOAR
MYPMCNTLRLVSRYYYFYYPGYTVHDKQTASNLNNNSNHTECVATNTEFWPMCGLFERDYRSSSLRFSDSMVVVEHGLYYIVLSL